MNKRSIHHLAAALAIFSVLAIALVLLTSIALGVTPTVTTAKATYLLGEDVSLPGSIDLIQGEALNIEMVTLDISGPQSVSQALPVDPGTYPFPSKGLTVDVSWQNIGLGFGYGYVNGYGYGYGYKGIGSPAKIVYDIKWDAPLFLDPPPTYTLLPNTTLAFSIPSVPPAPTPTPGGPPELPSFFDVFAIPQFPVAGLPQGAPAELPTVTQAFSIPQIQAPQPPQGVPTLEDATSTVLAFNLPDQRAPHALASDGTYFYVVVDNATPFQPNQILKLSVSGTSSSIVATLDAPSDQIGGLAYLGGYLWVADNLDMGSGRFLRKVDPSNGNVVVSYPFPESWVEIGGVGVSGTSLWLARNDGCGFYKVRSSNGTLQQQVFTWCGHMGSSVVESGAFLYKAHDNMVMKLNTQGQEVTTWNTALVDIQGSEFQSDILYLLDADTTAVYKTAIPSGITISKDPLGIAHDGTSTWLLIDATPVDKIAKVDPSNGNLLASYDSPGALSEGITYMGGYLWVAVNDNNQRKVYKINPADGSSPTNITAPGGGDIGGLSNNGTNLIAVNKTGNDVKVFTTSGVEQASEWIDGSAFSGHTGLAFDASGNRAFIANAGSIMKTGSTFDVQETWGTALSDIQGLAYQSAVLWIASNGDDKVYKASIPSGISVSTNPLGMAYDGTNLWILVDAAPVDKVLKVSLTGVLDQAGSFDASSSQTDAIAFVNGKLYIAVNQTSGTRTIVRHNPSGGAQEASFNTPGWDSVAGLTTDGTYLFSGGKQSGSVQVFSATGAFQSETWLGEFGPTGMGALAYYALESQLFAFKEGTVARYPSQGGSALQQWNTALGDINGATFVGTILYVADSTTGHVWATMVPQPELSLTTEPKGMATDGTHLYIVVDGSPKDRVLKISTTGTLVNSFDAPGNNADAIDYLGGYLYIGVNDPPPGGGGAQPRIFKVNKDTGATVGASFQVPNVWNLITALANDGTKLIVGQGFNDLWVLVDPANPQGATQVYQQPGQFPFMNGFQSLLFAVNNLYGVNGSLFNKFNKATGQTLSSTNLQPDTLNVTGLAYVGTTLYLADATSNTVRTATLAANLPELTIAGSYSAKLVLNANGTTLESSLANFSIQRIGQVVVNITAPEEQFSSTTTGILVSGNLNDPSITQVQVGIDLPFTTLFEDVVTATSSPAKWTASGLWHIACKQQEEQVFPKNKSFPCAWYYGKNDTQNYETGFANSGNLKINGPNNDGTITVGQGAELSFWTWWDTEPGPQFDRKQVQVSTNGGTSWQTIAMILAPFDINPQNGQPWFIPQDLQGPPIQWIPVPQANFNPQGQPIFDPVYINLEAFLGQDILIRFRFNTIDAAVNQPEGWYIDDVSVSGAGFLGTTATTTPVTDPVLQAQGIFGTFQATFNLAEGQNTVTAIATNPYDPALIGTDDVIGFLDTTPPNIALAQLVSPTATSTATVLGTIQDINFDELVLTQTTVLGTKTILTLKQLPQGGQFSQVVSLVEGLNTFAATATDGAGLSSSASVAATLDTAGPVVTVGSTTYPIGVLSARAGDPVIFNVNALDSGSGVNRVEIIFPGGGGGQPQIGHFIPSGEIPEAVRDLWGATGQWIMPIKIPSTAPPGTFSMTIRVFDNAGSQTATTVQAVVVSALEAFTFNLMPNQNFISLPLIADVPSIASSTAAVPGIQAVWYYDATLTNLPAEDRWLLYTPNPQDVDTLTTLANGRGYWFQMDPSAFALSAPLRPGLPQTPKPIKFTYTGQFLEPGTLPPSYAVVAGWNGIGFHSEQSLPVTTALQTLESPVRIWGSLLQYNNRIVFELPDDPTEEPVFQILLGAFQRLLSADSMTPGFGYWVFMVANGVIVP